MSSTPEQRRREAAQAEIPERAGGGQMGQQKTGMADASRTETDSKPDMPRDPGGRVREDTGRHGVAPPPNRAGRGS